MFKEHINKMLDTKKRKLFVNQNKSTNFAAADTRY